MTQTTTEPYREQRPMIEHPSWCSSAECEPAPDGRVHLSRPVGMQSPLTGLAVLVRLVQRSYDTHPDEGVPLVDLVIRYPDDGPDHPSEEYSICMDGDLAQAAGRILLDAGRQAST